LAFVDVLVMVTVALGTTEPVGSVTVPKTVAVWANAAALAMTVNTKTRQGFCIKPHFMAQLDGQSGIVYNILQPLTR
jgi:hypothetical protein